jgi:hypothetical protein
VTLDGRQIQGSPFFVDVDEQEVCVHSCMHACA